jgi:hypothetical protein
MCELDVHTPSITVLAACPYPPSVASRESPHFAFQNMINSVSRGLIVFALNASGSRALAYSKGVSPVRTARSLDLPMVKTLAEPLYVKLCGYALWTAYE